MKTSFAYGAALSLALLVSACGGKPSAVAGAAGQGEAYGARPSGAPLEADRPAYDDRRRAEAPLEGGRPLWASNRTHTAEENAQYQFNRNGRDFGAASESDYVAKAHAFIDHPPADVQIVDRRNGDRLMYDARNNVFAVVSRDGAPRTMFKPRGGATYWTQQKDRESPRQDGGATADASQG